MEIVFRAAGHLRTACRVPVAAAHVTAIVRIPRSRENCTRAVHGWVRGSSRGNGGQDRGGWVRGSGRARRIPFRRLLYVLSGVATSRRRLRRLENLSEQALFYTYYTLFLYISVGPVAMVRMYSERLNALDRIFLSTLFFLAAEFLISRPISFTAVQLQDVYIYIYEIPPRCTVYTNS